MKLSYALTFITLILSYGCADLFGHRSFVGSMNREEAFYNPGEDFPVSAGDSGDIKRSSEEVSARTPETQYESMQRRESLMIKNELAGLEGKLSPEEMGSYKVHSNYLETDSEKIYYLNLPASKRMDYLSSRRLASGSEFETTGSFGHLRRPASILDRELFLGMGKEAVVDSWGRPHRVDVAGDPRHQNERWSFYSNGQVKTVYFEQGQVQGWSVE